MKKIIALILALVMALSLVACGSTGSSSSVAGNSQSNAGSEAGSEGGEALESIKVGMVTDTGGVNDKSFNQTSWEGLQALNAEYPNIEVNYLESKTDADYQSNIETFMDEGYDLIICVGYMLADATREAAEANPDQKFAIIDDATIDLPNVACLMFSQAEGFRFHEPVRLRLHRWRQGCQRERYCPAVQCQQLRRSRCRWHRCQGHDHQGR